MKYQHILVAIDLSPRSKQVIQRAQAVAEKNNARVDIVHVIEHSPVAYGGEFSIPIDVNLEYNIETQARQSLASLGKETHIATQNQHVLSGSVKRVVIDLADKLGVDLIVVGTHGHQGLDKLLGSRANAILHGARCDVLAV